MTSPIDVQVFAGVHPERVAGLVLSHTGSLNPDRAARSRSFTRRVERLPMWISRSLLRLVVRLLVRRTQARRFWTKRYDEALRSVTREDMASRYELSASLDEGRWPRWNGPTLIIHSDNDDVAKPVERARLKDAYPHASWAEFAGTGHSSYLARPREFCDAVQAFVATAR